MSAQAVLSAAYTLRAQRADQADQMAGMLGKRDEFTETERHKLDDALGLLESPVADEGDGTTNVIQLRAFVDFVNNTMQ